MSLSPKELRTLRKKLAASYKTFADAKRVAKDLGLEVTVEEDASIITVWAGILEQVIAENLLEDLVDVVSDDDVIIDLGDISGAEKEPEKAPTKETRSIGFSDEIDEPEDKTNLYKNHLLLIGINDYSNGVKPLNNAVADIKKFKEIILDRYKFNANNITELIDSQATKANIIKTFDEVKAKLGKEDNLLFYFSGHGYLHEASGSGYWIPVDAKNGDRSTYLPNSEVRGFINSLKTQHTVGIVDSCFSGSLFVRSVDRVLKRYYNIPSRWLMTSGLNEVVSDGAPNSHSPFSESLLVHLENNEEPVLGMNALWLKVRQGVVDNAKQTPRCEPLQNTGHQGGEFFFIRKNAQLDSIPATQEITSATTMRELTNTGLDDMKTQLRSLVSTNELDEAFEILGNRVKESSRHKMTVYVRQGGYNDLKKREMQGIISATNANVQIANIRVALLYVVNQLEEEDLKS